MSGPQTGYEATGTWTTLAAETTFLADVVAGSPRATLETVGASNTGAHPLRKVTITEATDPNAPVILFIGGVHGNEPAGREIALTALRDLAYSTDPTIVSLLSKARFVVYPTASPSARAGNTRNTNGGTGIGWVNLNRDYLSLLLPEALMLQSALSTYKPLVIVDWHEYLAPTDARVTAETLPTTNLNVDPTLRAMIADLEAAIWDGWAAASVSHRRYVPLSPTPTSGWNAGALRNAVTITVETPAHPIAAIPESVRMGMMGTALTSVLGWINANFTSIQATTAAARAASAERGRTGADFTLTNEQVVSATAYESLADWPQILDVLGVAGDTAAVSLFQPERNLIPYVLDPDDPEALTTSTRVQGGWTPKPTPPGEWAETYVNVNGDVHPVVSAWFQDGTTLHQIQLP